MENRRKTEAFHIISPTRRRDSASDMVCFGKGWDDAAAHAELLTRCARERRVFFVEDARSSDGHPRLTLANTQRNLYIVRPHVRRESSHEVQKLQVQGLMTMLALDLGIRRPLTWFAAARDAGLAYRLGSSVTICGPIEAPTGARELPREWAQLLARAEIVLSPEMPESGADAATRRAFWDGQWAALQLMIAAVLIGRMREEVVEA